MLDDKRHTRSDLLEAALLEYMERYGASDLARRTLANTTVVALEIVRPKPRKLRTQQSDSVLV